ncbi:hypothetical protein ROZALSC1DRAFT_22050 [Rozella allomycis CSF55]|uniref:Uncharacterized protein n=1 Tax=Rozella allomycis (strain CSF55) TaxID=988480 RepID=A0A4P9YLE1_ROZAC|nr:hypothetical protein ROZALSC1DRAFT_22050 [Rozella allomycis CSF55]
MSELGLRGCHLKSNTQSTFEVYVKNVGLSGWCKNPQLYIANIFDDYHESTYCRIRLTKNCHEVCVPPFKAFEKHFNEHITYRHVDMGHHYAWLLPAKVQWRKYGSSGNELNRTKANTHLTHAINVNWNPTFKMIINREFIFKCRIRQYRSRFAKKGTAILVGPNFAYFNECAHIYVNALQEVLKQRMKLLSVL